jgi:hypothetical protein
MIPMNLSLIITTTAIMATSNPLRATSNSLCATSNSSCATSNPLCIVCQKREQYQDPASKQYFPYCLPSDCYYECKYCSPSYCSFNCQMKRCTYPNTDDPRCRLCDKGAFIDVSVTPFRYSPGCPEHLDQAIKMGFDTPRFYLPIQVYQCVEKGYIKINCQSSTLDIMSRYCRSCLC